jgi:predicted Zn-dependent protease
MKYEGSKLRIGFRGFTFLTLAALALVNVSCTTIDAVSGQSVYNIYTITDDIQLGRNTIQSNTEALQEQGVPINQDPARLAQLSNMVERITAVADMPELPYTVTLYHTNIVNAAAAPGGSMIVFSGLYSDEVGLARDEDELAAIMAHEVAHVNCRHSTERLSKLMTAAIGTEIAAAVLESNDEDDWAMGLRALFAVGTAVYVPIHSQKDEFEADRVGLFYLARAGYDPRAAPRIWKRVSDEQDGEHHKASIFATHPSAWDRYEALEKMLPYAMDEYARATGSYPTDYAPPEWYTPGATDFDWRNPAK